MDGRSLELTLPRPRAHVVTPTHPRLPRVDEVVCGKYQIRRLLMKGATGEVMAAEALESAKMVALGFVGAGVYGRDAEARLDCEARVAARLRSRHAVRILGCERLPTGSPFIVMEPLHGRRISDLLDEGVKLRLSSVIRYIVQACEAVAEAHKLGLVHGRIGNDTLFLTSDCERDVHVKVLGFGFTIDEPSGWPGLDPRVDIAGLGKTLLEHLEREADVPRSIEVIVRRCLEPSPARFQTAGDLAQALERALGAMSGDVEAPVSAPSRPVVDAWEPTLASPSGHAPAPAHAPPPAPAHSPAESRSRPTVPRLRDVRGLALFLPSWLTPAVIGAAFAVSVIAMLASLSALRLDGRAKPARSHLAPPADPIPTPVPPVPVPRVLAVSVPAAPASVAPTIVAPAPVRVTPTPRPAHEPAKIAPVQRRAQSANDRTASPAIFDAALARH